jgi:hypothetical protein
LVIGVSSGACLLQYDGDTPFAEGRIVEWAARRALLERCATACRNGLARV